MPSSIQDNQKSKRGRPFTGGRGLMIGVRLHPDDLELLDLWIAANGEMSRPEAMRKILRLVALRMSIEP